jgi:hypothetical protein
MLCLKKIAAKGNLAAIVSKQKHEWIFDGVKVGTLRPQIFKKEMMIALPLCST